jgi:NAD(P)H-dependent FMN reductase
LSDVKILAISDSLRAASLNTAVLQAAGRLAPDGVKGRELRQERLRG